jgi:hypothetical protein
MFSRLRFFSFLLAATLALLTVNGANAAHGPATATEAQQAALAPAPNDVAPVRLAQISIGGGGIQIGIGGSYGSPRRYRDRQRSEQGPRYRRPDRQRSRRRPRPEYDREHARRPRPCSRYGQYGKRPCRPRPPRLPVIVITPPPPQFEDDDDYLPPPRRTRPTPPPRTAKPREPRQPASPPRRRIATPPPPAVIPPIPSPRPPVLTAEPDHWPGEVVVQLAAGSPHTTEDELARDYNLTFVVSETNTLVDRRIVRYQFGGQRNAATVTATLAADPRVAGAQPNWRYRVLQGARDEGNASAALQYASMKLGLADAHVIAKGRGVKVAVIDSGVDRTHPALADAVSRSFNAAGNRGKEIGAHGTAIAGILKAQGLLKGVAPAAELLAVRAFFSNSAGGEEQSSTAIIMRALDWAVRHEARVVNMSFAGPRDTAVEEAVTAARKRGVILVAAAGNGGPDAAPAYPAAYRDVIAVTATDTQDRLYGKANRGPYIDVAAPGVDIFVVAPAKAYRHSSGTSLAAAHVSGIVALLLERDASLDGAAVADILKQGAADLGKPGLDPDFGAGRVDTLKLLRAATVEIAKPAGR